MAEVPDLTLIITEHGSWGCDRFFRPLLETYERVHLDTTLYFLDGGIEDLVSTYGPGRLLFGSGLPERYPGGMMMYLRHCQIDDEARAAIAGDNLARLLEEVEL
jgi:predicted TIM-barrel fold metal-dependent hydrolase